MVYQNRQNKQRLKNKNDLIENGNGFMEKSHSKW